MKPEDRIKEGDLVHVDINQAQITLCHEAEVLHMPNRAGDSLVFKELRKGPKGVVETFIHYVSEGCTVSKKLDQRTDENAASPAVMRKKGRLFCPRCTGALVDPDEIPG
jgi:hypothetical protein